MSLKMLDNFEEVAKKALRLNNETSKKWISLNNLK